jgi:hypothetical protein
MLDCRRPAGRRVVACLGLLLLVAVRPASAQQVPTPPPASAPAFLPRFDMAFSWAALVTPDPRFAWAARLGADLDLVDYRVGRLNLVVDYEAVLGSERRAFDLNHGNYVLEASSSYRVASVDVSGVFHHVSRHLSDRPNPDTIAWNVVTLRAVRQFGVGRSTVDARVDAGRVLQHTFVDYLWTGELGLAIRRPISPRVGLFADGTGDLVGVDRTVAQRDRQCGARVEAGVHLNGREGALELFAGYERRIDAYPLDRHRFRWFSVGFRLVSR